MAPHPEYELAEGGDELSSLQHEVVADYHDDQHDHEHDQRILVDADRDDSRRAGDSTLAPWRERAMVIMLVGIAVLIQYSQRAVGFLTRSRIPSRHAALELPGCDQYAARPFAMLSPRCHPIVSVSHHSVVSSYSTSPAPSPLHSV